jgi:hypothetical protein
MLRLSVHRTSNRCRRFLFTLAGLVAAVTAVVTAPAAAGATAAEVTVAPVVPSSVAPTVPLVTGARIVVTPAGVAVRSSGGNAGGFISFSENGDHYVIPGVAQPYIGRQLDLSLFDVSALARAGVRGGGHIPVSLSFNPGTAPAAPPGITVTSISGNFASGFVTASSGPAFAGWLQAHIRADIAAGRQPGSSPLPGGLTAMSLAAPAPGGPVEPDYPLHIAQFNATDLAGQPVNSAFMILENMDSYQEANALPVPIEDGIARVAVPAGHYAAFVAFSDYDAQGEMIATRFVTPHFTVPGTNGTTIVAIPESSATSRVRITSTPLPADRDYLAAGFTWQDAAGQVSPGISGFEAFFGGSQGDIYVAPEPAAPVGEVHLQVQWGGAPPAGSSSNYRYDVAFGSYDVPTDEAYAVRPDQLATVQHLFSTDPAGGTAGYVLSGAADPVTGSWEAAFYTPQPEPGTLTQYVGTADGGRWMEWALNSLEFKDNFVSDYRDFSAGQPYTLNWAHGPIAPAFGQHTGRNPLGQPAPCMACSAGSTLTLAYTSLGDSDPAQWGFTYAPGNYHFEMYRNGAELVDAANALGAVLTGIPTVPSTYRAVLDMDFTGAGEPISQSTRTHTDLTFKYTPGTPGGSALPPEDFCNGESAETPCQILPVLSLNYGLVTDLYNTSQGRSQVQIMHLHVGHLTYDGMGSHASITSAAVSVSFDGGTTWTPATVAGTDGHYVVTWPNPASARGTDPELKVSATDAAGGAITQTITNAYTIAAPTS